jgi:hypothetical protein
VATRASYVCGRIREARVAVEAPPRSQADEDLARTPFEPSLDLDRVVARVEDEQGDWPYFPQPIQQSLHLPASNLVSILCGADALYVHGSAPTLAHEVQLCDELVGPARDDGLTRGVSGRMVVETTLGAALGVAAIPHANVYGVDGCFALSKRMAGEKPP